MNNLHILYIRNQAAEKVSDPIAQKYNIEQDSPVVGIIETEGDQKSETEDGEVFYIFYENEKLQQVYYIITYV